MFRSTYLLFFKNVRYTYVMQSVDIVIIYLRNDIIVDQLHLDSERSYINI